jgi:hypothetical protein
MATTKKEALEESIKSLTMEYAKKIFENGDHGFDCRDMRGLPIEKELFEEYVNKRKPLLEELYECENPDMCFEDFEDDENIKFDNIYERIILEYGKLTEDGVYGWDFDNLKPNEEIQKYMREYLKIEDVEDDWVEDDEEYDIEDEDISDEQYDVFEEQMEDVFTDINNIFSNISDIEGNVNYYFPSELKIKEEIFSILKEIEEKTDTLLEKIYKLVYYMK